MTPSTRRLLVFSGLGLAAGVVTCVGVLGPCWSAWAFDGIVVYTCPQGAVRPVAFVRAEQLGRGDLGRVVVGVAGHHLAPRHGPQVAAVRRFDVTLVAVDPDGKETVLEPEDGWRPAGWVGEDDPDAASEAWEAARVKLPEGPDGDWTLRAVVSSPAGEATAEATLPLYAPALTHVLTDAPLYKPGQTLRFRAVTLHERDLTPLGARPGRWKVYDPEGNLLLDEKARTSPMGVAASDFPLDPLAPAGTWRVRYETGASADEVSVEVREFQLPRFSVEARSERRWWARGEMPVVTGTVRYRSGAPVVASPVRVRLVGHTGEWPPPTAWTEERVVTTDRDGRLRFALDAVPADLRGAPTLTFALSATEPAGGVAQATVSVKLSEETLAVDAVTELAGGLVPDANNRLYLRVTTPDGEPLRGRPVRLRREWDPDDPGVVAVADADGVARFQLDPGAPVTVVVPPMPVRPPPRDESARVRVTGATDALTGADLDVASRVALDGWAQALEACAVRATPGGEAGLVVAARIDARGRVTRALVRDESGAADPLTRCVERVVTGRGGPAGAERLWRVSLGVRDAEAPWFAPSVSSVLGDAGALDSALRGALREARECAAEAEAGAEAPWVWTWTTSAGSRRVEWSATPNPSTSAQLGGAAAGCLGRVVAGVGLPEDARDAATGVLRVSVDAPRRATERAPEPTTWPGFAFQVEAGDKGELGQGTLRMRPGEVPPLRLRWSEVVVDPGATVELTALRGPGGPEELPKKVPVMAGDRKLGDLELDPQKRLGTFTLPSDARGFVSVTLGEARALLYIRAPEALAVALDADAPTYRPGDTATLTVTTRDGTGPVAAGVLLSGVDEGLAALATLPGPDDFARVVARATSDAPAFGVLDARALQTGLVTGENAAQAAVLRVSTVPPLPPGAARADGAGRSAFDRDGELADAFYGLYAEVRKGVRAWETSAPAGEVMTPAKMVELWERALDAHPARDPFGNPLHLSAVPHDLLPLTDPRVLVADAARLPEDVEDWARYVSREAP